MVKYLLEIKNRLVLLFIALFATVFICYFYKEILLFTIVQPYTFTGIKESMNISYFIFTNVTEILSVYITLVTFLSIQIFYAYMGYHFFLFVSPALFYVEYLFWKLSIKIIGITWIISMVLSTYLLIPITWYFFLSFQNLNLKHSFNLHFEAKLKEYLNFYISSYFLYLFYFQFFIFLILFLNYTNFNIKKIKKFRKFNYYCLVVLSTAISPPEVLSQLYIGLFVILVYELSLFIYLFRANY